MKSSLLSVLMFSAVLWPAATFAQTAPDAMAKAVKADNMKWEPLGDTPFEISILYTNPTTQATYLVIRGPGNHLAGCAGRAQSGLSLTRTLPARWPEPAGVSDRPTRSYTAV